MSSELFQTPQKDQKQNNYYVKNQISSVSKKQLKYFNEDDRSTNSSGGSSDDEINISISTHNHKLSNAANSYAAKQINFLNHNTSFQNKVNQLVNFDTRSQSILDQLSIPLHNMNSNKNSISLNNTTSNINLVNNNNNNNTHKNQKFQMNIINTNTSSITSNINQQIIPQLQQELTPSSSQQNISTNPEMNPLDPRYNSSLQHQKPRIDHTKFKTEMCRNWQATGHCNYGTKCKYAHGEQEMVTKQIDNAFYKTRGCKLYYEQGYCSYGTRCHFIHNNTKSLDEVKKLNYSKYLELGYVCPRKRLGVFEQISLTSQEEEDQIEFLNQKKIFGSTTNMNANESINMSLNTMSTSVANKDTQQLFAKKSLLILGENLFQNTTSNMSTSSFTNNLNMNFSSTSTACNSPNNNSQQKAQDFLSFLSSGQSPRIQELSQLFQLVQ